MKFKMRVRHKGTSDEGWWEDYDKPTDQSAESVAAGIIDYFNSTLNEREKPRELLEVVTIDPESVTGMHQWEKTNGVTARINGQLCDLFRCKNCRITGKRFGLSSQIKRDTAFRKKAFGDCRTARQIQKIN